jgi:hypothetical protein
MTGMMSERPLLADTGYSTDFSECPLPLQSGLSLQEVIVIKVS